MSVPTPTNPWRVLHSRAGEPPREIALLFPPQGEWTEDEYDSSLLPGLCVAVDAVFAAGQGDS